MGDSTIQWTDKTWNPVTGCTKVSQGCKNCYAESVANRFFGKQYPPVPFSYSEKGGAIYRAREFTDVMTHNDRLDQPLHWRKPAKVFVNSMSDLFHEAVPFEFIYQTFNVMASADIHTYQVLTKRPQRMLEWFRWLERTNSSGQPVRRLQLMADEFPLSNVWIGVSVEDQKTADERIPLLLRTPAAVRFVSYEPALGPVNFQKCLSKQFDHCPDEHDGECEGCDPVSMTATGDYCGAVFMPRIDWIIVGGESGSGARPFNVQWARDVIRQCEEAGVPVFVKQMGAKPYQWVFEDRIEGRLKDGHGGDIEEWPDDLRVREFPAQRNKV